MPCVCPDCDPLTHTLPRDPAGPAGPDVLQGQLLPWIFKRKCSGAQSHTLFSESHCPLSCLFWCMIPPPPCCSSLPFFPFIHAVQSLLSVPGSDASAVFTCPEVLVDTHLTSLTWAGGLVCGFSVEVPCHHPRAESQDPLSVILGVRW